MSTTVTSGVVMDRVLPEILVFGLRNFQGTLQGEQGYFFSTRYDTKTRAGFLVFFYIRVHKIMFNTEILT